MKFETKLIHGGQSEDQATGAVSIPVYRSSTFHQYELGGNPKWEYSRTGNPTRAALEALIDDLEGGVAGFAFASGSAAIHATFSMYSAHDHFIVGSDVYGGTFRLINKVLKRFGLEFTVVDMQDLAAVENAIQDNTVAIYFETPTNPLLQIADIAAITKIAKKQMDHFGAMISFELQEGLDTKKFVESLKVISLAESLGGIESLIEVPSVMTHGSIPREIRLENGIKDELIRLSVGIEDEEDLINDLKQALDKIG